MKLTVEQAEAVTALLTRPEFRIFMDFIGTKGEESMQQYIAATKGRKTKQGKCQVYTEIVDAVAGAKKTFEDYQNSK